MSSPILVTDHDWFEYLSTHGPFELVPAWLAWEAFGDKNGAADFAGMRDRIEKLRRSTGSAGHAASTAGGASATRAGDYSIGCLMITQPVFLLREAWVRPPADWPDNAVQGKSYDLTEGEGARVWQEVLAAAGAQRTGASLSGPVTGAPPARPPAPATATRPSSDRASARGPSASP